MPIGLEGGHGYSRVCLRRQVEPTGDHTAGHRYLHTALIEANQRGYRSAVLGKDEKSRRARSSSAYVAIADRCLQRLNKKGSRLLLAGKHPNKVKVACAREMVGFVWESLTQAAAA